MPSLKSTVGLRLAFSLSTLFPISSAIAFSIPPVLIVLLLLFGAASYKVADINDLYQSQQQEKLISELQAEKLQLEESLAHKEKERNQMAALAEARGTDAVHRARCGEQLQEGLVPRKDHGLRRALVARAPRCPRRAGPEPRGLRRRLRAASHGLPRGRACLCMRRAHLPRRKIGDRRHVPRRRPGARWWLAFRRWLIFHRRRWLRRTAQERPVPELGRAVHGELTHSFQV